MKKLFLIPLMILLISGLVFSGCAKPAPAPAPAPPPQPIEWTLQSMWARADILFETLPIFSDYVWEKSNGRLKINIFAEPEIVPMMEVLQSTQLGVLDMTHGGSLWELSVPVAGVEFGSPTLYMLPEYTSFKAKSDAVREFFYESGMVDLLRREYAKHNLYWLDLHTGAEALILSTKPVHTLEEIKGLKINEITQGWVAVWLKEVGWGAVPGLPPSEVYMALKLGTVDAAVFDTSAITHMNWHEVAPYWINNMLFSDLVVCNMLVNTDSWNALPDDLKKVVADGADVYYHGVVDAYSAHYAVVQEIVKKGEVILNPMDKEYEQRAIEAGEIVLDMVAETDPASAEAIELIKQWRGRK